MPTLQEQIDQRANVWAQMTDIWTRCNGQPSGEEAQAYDRAEAELDALGLEIERAERHAETEQRIAAVNRQGVVAPGGGQDDRSERERQYSAAFNRFIRNPSGTAGLSDEDRRVVQGGFVSGDQFKMAAGVGTGAAGGFMVPPEFRNILVETLLASGPMLQLAERLETDSGQTLPWPTNDDTGERRRHPGGEHADHRAGRHARAGDARRVHVHLEAGAGLLAAAAGQRVQPGQSGWPASSVERIGRIAEHPLHHRHRHRPAARACRPTPSSGKTGTTGQTTSVIYDDLIDLIHSVDPAYRNSGPCRFMMLRRHAGHGVRKLKDTQQPSPVGAVRAGRRPGRAARLQVRRQQRHAGHGGERQVDPVRRLLRRLRHP
jgi:predicted phage gp36 major capsid-like protein